MLAADTTTITVPSWVGKLALPDYPSMPEAGYLMLGLGALVLLIGFFAPVRKFPALLTGLALLAYYPLAYLFFWFLLRFNQVVQPERESSKFEDYLRERLHTFSGVILWVCMAISVLFFLWTVWATIRKGRRPRTRETASADNPFTPQPAPQAAAAPQPAPAVPAAPRPAAVPRPTAPQAQAQARKVPRNPPSPQSDNPFNFG
jgi:hypothetical protein